MSLKPSNQYVKIAQGGTWVPPLTRFPLTALSRCGGMADAADSKSAVGNYMWVQVPPPAVSNADFMIATTYCASSFFQHQYL